MKTMQKTLCALLVFVLLLGLCTVPASATRVSEANAFLLEHIMKDGKSGMFGMYAISGEQVTDVGSAGSCTCTGVSMICNSETRAISLYGGAYWQDISIGIPESDTEDVFSCYLSSSATQEGILLNRNKIYKDTKIAFSNYRGGEDTKEESEYFMTIAFHRAMAFLDSQLRLGGFTLADLGFINYDKNSPAPCPDYGIHCPGRFFNDMPNGDNWAHQAIDWAIQNEITSGTSNYTFSPNKACTRAQVVTFLWRAAGRPEPESTENSFEDIDPNAFYYTPVLWAVESGLTKGITETTFKPEGECTRAQVVTFLWRLNGSVKDSAKSEFSDVAQDAYYTDAVNWAVANGITEGTGSGKFSPNRSCTRAHVVTFLYRA